MSNSSVAQVMVAQIGGAADSSSHPMQGPLSSAVCGSAQPTGGVSSRFEDVLVDARLSAGRSSGSSNLRPRSSQSAGTAGETLVAKTENGGQGEEAGAGLADEAGMIESSACLAAAFAGIAETVCFEPTATDFANSIGDCPETLGLEGVGRTIRAGFAQQMHNGTKLGPGVQSPGFGSARLAGFTTIPLVADASGEAGAAASGMAVGQHLWPKPPLAAMQGNQPFIGLRFGGAIGLNSVGVGPALAWGAMPGAGWSTMIVPGPARTVHHTRDLDGVIHQAPVNSTHSEGLTAIGSPMPTEVPVDTAREGTAQAEIDPDMMQLQGASTESEAAQSTQSGADPDSAQVLMNAAQDTDGGRAAGGNPIGSRRNLMRSEALASRPGRGRKPATAAGAGSARALGRLPYTADRALQGELDAGPQRQRLFRRKRDSGAAARRGKRTQTGRDRMGCSSRIRLHLDAESSMHTRWCGLGPRRQFTLAERSDSAYTVKTGRSRVQAGAISVRRQHVPTGLESGTRVTGAAGRQSIAAELETVFAEPGDSGPGRSIVSMDAATQEPAATGARDVNGAPTSQETDASPGRVADKSLEATADARPKRAVETSWETAAGAPLERATDESWPRAADTSLERATNASWERATDTAAERAAVTSSERAAAASWERATNTASQRVSNTSPETAADTSLASARTTERGHSLRVEAGSGRSAIVETEEAPVTDGQTSAIRASGTQPQDQRGTGQAIETMVRARSAMREQQPTETAQTGDSESMHIDTRLPETRIETTAPKAAVAESAEPRSVIEQIVNRVALRIQASAITIRLRPSALGLWKCELRSTTPGGSSPEFGQRPVRLCAYFVHLRTGSCSHSGSRGWTCRRSGSVRFAAHRLTPAGKSCDTGWHRDNITMEARPVCRQAIIIPDTIGRAGSTSRTLTLTGTIIRWMRLSCRRIHSTAARMDLQVGRGVERRAERRNNRQGGKNLQYSTAVNQTATDYSNVNVSSRQEGVGQERFSHAADNGAPNQDAQCRRQKPVYAASCPVASMEQMERRRSGETGVA